MDSLAHCLAHAHRQPRLYRSYDFAVGGGFYNNLLHGHNSKIQNIKCERVVLSYCPFTIIVVDLN